MQFAQLGMMNAVCVLGGTGLGWLADSRLHTLPAFLFAGLAAGSSLGAVTTWREVKKYL